MSKKVLLSIFIVLVITNIITIYFLTRGHEITVNNDSEVLSPNDVVAKINGESISYIEWLQELIQNNGERNLKKLIDKEVVRQLANQYEIEINEKMVQRELYLLLTMQEAMTEEEWKQLEKDLRRDIIYRYQLQLLLTRDFNISDDEARSFYDSYKNQYDFNEAMQISHIVVHDHKTANTVMDLLDQGSSFSTIAERYSIDEATKTRGGYIGFIHTNSDFFPSGYDTVVRAMNEYSYSEPFQTNNGIVILYLHRKLPNITFTFEEIKPYVKSELIMKQQNLELSPDKLWNELDIEWIYSK